MGESATLCTIGRELVAKRQQITDEWIQHVATIPDLQRLSPAELLDHLPEFLYELAGACTGDPNATVRACERLISSHALQRLRLGVAIPTLLEEYSALREVLLPYLLRSVPEDDVRAEVVALERTLDLAISESIRMFAEQRDEVREHLVGMLGHDLRSPLQALIGGAERILRQPDCGQSTHARAAATILNSAERMGRLISDIIDFTRAQLGGGIPVAPVRCDMGEICREVADEMRTAHPARALSVTTEGDLVGAWDRDRVVQAISNLVSNALAHGFDPITIRACEGTDPQSVITEVHNFGPAIPPDLIPHLFDAYSRGRTSPPGGLGLGLFIVQQIALAHGGQCAVRSDESEGTTFSIRWPRTPPSEGPRPRGRR